MSKGLFNKPRLLGSLIHIDAEPPAHKFSQVHLYDENIAKISTYLHSWSAIRKGWKSYIFLLNLDENKKIILQKINHYLLNSWQANRVVKQSTTVKMNISPFGLTEYYNSFIKEENSKQKMGVTMLLVLVSLIFTPRYLTLTILANSAQFQIEVFQEGTITPHTNSSSTNYPLDTVRQVITSRSYFYILSTDNVVEIYDKNNPSILQGGIYDYFLSSSARSLRPIYFMAMDGSYDILVLTGFSNSVLTHFIYTTTNQSLPVLSSTFNVQTQYSQPPVKTFILNSIVYSFFSASGSDDIIHSFNLIDNSSVTSSLPTNNASFASSPDNQIVVAWTTQSIFSFFDITNNFKQLSIYSASVTNQPGATQFVKFSRDSAYAILETDSYNPLRVIKLADFTIAFSFSMAQRIICADFIDSSNRFILVNGVQNAYIIDTLTFSTVGFNGSLAANSILVDQDSSQLIADIGGRFSFFGINGTVNGTLQFSHDPISNNSAVSPSVSNSTNSNPVAPNATISNNSASNNSSVINSSTVYPDSPFQYPLSPNIWQNQTFEVMGEVSSITNKALFMFNSIVFSSPFTCFFLGFFNYFVLNSLYVLLPIKLPDLVFNQLATIFASVNSNLITFIGVKLPIPVLSDQLVDEDRPLYFGVSSDLLSTNAYSLCIICFNVILVEAIIAVRKDCSKGSFFSHFLALKRKRVYLGFMIQILVQNVLPWTYITFKGFSNYGTKSNTFCFHIIFNSAIFFLFVSFLSLFYRSQVSRVRKEQVHEWVVGFQDFLYPLLVLINQPLLFLLLILCSKIAQTVVYAKNSKDIMFMKVMQMGSFLCELIYHLTFFAFFLSVDYAINNYSSMICLFFFLSGAIINFLMLFVICAQFIAFLCKKSNRIRHQVVKPDKLQTKQSKIRKQVCEQPKKIQGCLNEVEPKQRLYSKMKFPPISNRNHKRYIWRQRSCIRAQLEPKVQRKTVQLFGKHQKSQI